MNIFIICSKRFYDRVPEIKNTLEGSGHTIVLPNSFDNPGQEEEMRAKSTEAYAAWKAAMIRLSEEKMEHIDAVLVLNFEKNGIKNYIGGATFIEMYDAFRMHRKIFLYNDIPEGMLFDEIFGFCPILIKGDLHKVV